MEDTLPSAFPLYASIKTMTQEEDADYVLCLWKSPHSEEELCGHRCSHDFIDLLAHLKEVHHLRLVPGVDYSVDSGLIIRNRLDALEFFLSKAMAYEDLQLTLESPVDTELTEWLGPIFEKLAAIQKR